MLDIKEFTSYNQEDIDLLLRTVWNDDNNTEYTGYDLLNLLLDGAELSFKIVEQFLKDLDMYDLINREKMYFQILQFLNYLTSVKCM